MKYNKFKEGDKVYFNGRRYTGHYVYDFDYDFELNRVYVIDKINRFKDNSV